MLGFFIFPELRCNLDLVWSVYTTESLPTLMFSFLQRFTVSLAENLICKGVYRMSSIITLFVKGCYSVNVKAMSLIEHCFTVLYL